MQHDQAAVQSGPYPLGVVDASTDTAMRTRAPRRWQALLTLFFLAPLFGEVFSTSTTPLQVLFDPTRLFWTPALYGSGAILARELVRRRGLGWASLLTLGAAYGVLEEALVTNTWFNPAANVQALGIYGRIWSVNTVWALELTVFHAVMSICIPIALVEAAFPRVAARPWLRRRGIVGFGVLLTLVSLIGLYGWGFYFYRNQGYTHPPVPQYFVAVALAVVLVLLGLRITPQPPHPRGTRAAPSPRRVYWSALAAMFAFLLVTYVFSGLKLPVALTLGTMAALVALMAIAVTRWSRRGGWDQQHVLALTTGALTFWLIFTPAIELLGGDVIDGAATALIALLLTIWLRRLRRKTATLSATEQ